MIKNPSSLKFEHVSAQFNGLLWRDEQRHSALLPYFVDLASKTWYHNSCCSVHTKTGTGWKQGSGSRNARRFVYRGLDGEDLEIVDLATRTVTVVKSLGEAGERMVLFPGFSDGRLGVWGYNEKTQRRYSRHLHRLKEINPDQEEYDVSGVAE